MSVTKMLEKVINSVVIRNETFRQALAEALATFILMAFGLGSVAQVVLGEKHFGEYLSINLGFGLGVMLGIHAAGGISGAHMNASITFANCVVGKLLWRKLPAYVIGQFLGSFAASALIFVLYYGKGLHFWAGSKEAVTEGYNRSPTELHGRKPDCDGAYSHRRDLCHLPCPLHVPVERVPTGAYCNQHAHDWYPCHQ
ncbi:aquaporin-7-like isoform X3 [Candoia aspera]|uniref:aquaporin-7-like isoform X3 n=1 Tax=Candoia aspera TaxID=51853 RepID=UPI002FD7D0C1